MHHNLNLRDMYRMRTNIPDQTCQTPGKKQLREPKFSISLEKFDKCWVFVLEEKRYFELLQILQKYCVLTHFHEMYEVNQIIGKGRFAIVYSVTKKTTGEVFAAKIIKKDNKDYENYKVLIIKHKKNDY